MSELSAAPFKLKFRKNVFEDSGIYIPSVGLLFAIVKVQGAGGGGRSASSNAGGAGGGAGGYAEKVFTVSEINVMGANIPVIIGARGEGGIAGSLGTDGGDSYFNDITTLYATGGAGGTTQAVSSIDVLGGNGGEGFYGDINISGQDGTAGFWYGSVCGGAGGDSVLGSGGEARHTGNAPPSAGLQGQDGKGYGAGGSGSVKFNGTPSAGNGTQGVIIIEEYLN